MYICIVCCKLPFLISNFVDLILLSSFFFLFLFFFFFDESRYKNTSDLKAHIYWKWEDEKILHANEKQKKVGVAILVSDKIDLKIKNITRDKEEHYILVKGSIQDEDITIVNIYTVCGKLPWYQDCVKNFRSLCLSWAPSWLSEVDTIKLHLVEKEMATHSSILAWRIPWTEEPGRL